ncbi:hypothetical protein [Azospirillum largimobile]
MGGCRVVVGRHRPHGSVRALGLADGRLYRLAVDVVRGRSAPCRCGLRVAVQPSGAVREKSGTSHTPLV